MGLVDELSLFRECCVCVASGVVAFDALNVFGRVLCVCCFRCVLHCLSCLFCPCVCCVCCIWCVS